MVKIAIAGGSGGKPITPKQSQPNKSLTDVLTEVSREIVDAIIAAERHEILLLSRKDVSAQKQMPHCRWVQVNYDDTAELAKALHGVDTVLSFVTPQTDPGNKAQKNLVDASISAGVRRFAPSEWATSSFEHMDWYSGKGEIREYLKAMNKDRKVLEYCLFQPGLFINYFTHPHRSAKHVNTFQTQFDFENRRAIIPAGSENAKLALITAQDLANVVVRAIEYDGEWPVNGGIKGCEMSITQLIELGEKVRGGSFIIERLEIDDLKNGIVKSSWMPRVSHPAISPEQAEALSKDLLAGMTLGISVGALNVSDEWNRLLPDYQFTQPYRFLLEAWSGKA